MRPGRFWFGFLLAAVMACAAEKAPPGHVPMAVANGCFVESVALLDAWPEMAGAESWAKLLRWGAKEEEEVVAGHAVAVVEREHRRLMLNG